MSSLSNALAVNKTVNINGTDVAFSRIDLFDLAKIDEGRKAHAKTVAKANAKEAGLTPADVYNVCVDIDLRSFTVGEMLAHARTPGGAAEVLTHSLVKVGKTKDEAKAIISHLPSHEATELAIDLMLVRRNPETSDPNASTAAAGTPATADSSPASTSTTTATGPTTSTNAEPKGFGD